MISERIFKFPQTKSCFKFYLIFHWFGAKYFIQFKFFLLEHLNEILYMYGCVFKCIFYAVKFFIHTCACIDLVIWTYLQFKLLEFVWSWYRNALLLLHKVYKIFFFFSNIFTSHLCIYYDAREFVAFCSASILQSGICVPLQLNLLVWDHEHPLAHAAHKNNLFELCLHI